MKHEVMFARRLPLLVNLRGPKALGKKRRGDGGDADIAPLPLAVLDEFADDERSKYSGFPDPMASRSHRGVWLVICLALRRSASVGWMVV